MHQMLVGAVVRSDPDGLLPNTDPVVSGAVLLSAVLRRGHSRHLERRADVRLCVPAQLTSSASLCQQHPLQLREYALRKPLILQRLRIDENPLTDSWLNFVAVSPFFS
jgi:hypothetical protein